jgi:hypothetical protein
MQFDNAKGFLLGDASGGLKSSFSMINTMRLEVAVQGVGVASAAAQAATTYANTRTQGSRGNGAAHIEQHPDVKRNLLTMHALTKAARVLVYEIAKLQDLSLHGRDGATRRTAAQLAAFLLPVCKAGCAETAVEVASLAIQIHGGHGYIRDTGVERLFRDARTLPIYEGTTGIQAIDLVLRKLPEGRAFSEFIARIRIDIHRATEAGGPGLIEGMRDAVETCMAEYIDLPPVNLPTIEFDFERDGHERIEELADQLREFWNVGFGPIIGLIPLLEYNGIIVVEEPVNCDDMDAVSRWQGG